MLIKRFVCVTKIEKLLYSGWTILLTHLRFKSLQHVLEIGLTSRFQELKQSDQRFLVFWLKIRNHWHGVQNLSQRPNISTNVIQNAKETVKMTSTLLRIRVICQKNGEGHVAGLLIQCAENLS